MSAGDVCDAVVVVAGGATAPVDGKADDPRLAGRKRPWAVLRARAEAEEAVPRLDCCCSVEDDDADRSEPSALNTRNKYVPVYWQRIVIGTTAASRVAACGAEKNST